MQSSYFMRFEINMGWIQVPYLVIYQTSDIEQVT